jgi:WD40 repeat protein
MSLPGLAVASACSTFIWQSSEPDNKRAVVEITHPSPVSAVRWNGSNTVHCSASGGRVLIHKGLTKLLGVLPSGCVDSLGSDVTCLAFSKGSKHLAAGCSDGVVHLWDLKRQACAAPFPAS